MTCIGIHDQAGYDAHKDDPRACLHVRGDLDEITAGTARVTVCDSARVKVVRGSAQVHKVRDSAEVYVVRDSAQVHEVRDSAQVHQVASHAYVHVVRDSAQVHEVRDSAQVHEVRDSAQVNEVRGSAQVNGVWDSAQVHGVWDSAQIHGVWDSAQVHGVCDTAQIHEVRDSAQVHEVRDSAQVHEVRDSAQVNEVRGSAQVNGVWDSAQVHGVWDSAQIHGVCDTAQIHGVWDSAQIHAVAGTAVAHAHGGTIRTTGRYATVYRHDPAARVTGPARIIDVPSTDTATPAEWAAFAGIPVTEGYMTVWKAVDGDLRSGYGTAYPVGATVTAPDWAPTRECGHGLHFAALPAQASVNLRAGTKRYLACRVALADTVVIDAAKVKARECVVLYEADITGQPIPDGDRSGGAR